MPRLHQMMVLSAFIPAVILAPARSHRPVPITAPGVVTLTLSDWHIDAPASIPSGYTTFRAVNVGKELHHATLVRLGAGKTMADLVAALKSPGPPPPWATWLGGPQNAGTAIIRVTPGTYVWLCLIPGADGVPHFVKGMITPMTVTAASNGAASPAADITVTMQDYGWVVSKAITAGSHVLKVVTAPGQPHEFVVVRLAPGKKAADVTAWIDKMAGPPPVESIEGISALQATETNYTTIAFKPGHYAFFCFMPDAKDGKEHVTHGMVKEIVVQ